MTLANPITIGGSQFSSNGYVLSGNQLTLGDAHTVLSVGDGTAADATMTATISADIAGDGQLVKSGAGILVLNAANSYTGGTLIDRACSWPRFVGPECRGDWSFQHRRQADVQSAVGSKCDCDRCS